MIGYSIRRFLQAAAVMLVMSALVFAGIHAVGNPIDVLIAPDASQEIRAQTIAAYGLDKPLVIQYLAFLERLLQGDFGRSFVFHVPVIQLIFSLLPATLELAVVAVLGATLVAIPLGMYAGYRPDSLFSKAVMAFSIVAFSVPTFWIGLLLIFTFAVSLGWLPSGGRGETVTLMGIKWSFLTLNGLQHLLLPALTLSLFKFSMILRLARSGTREVMLGDTVRFARAMGESEATVLRRHVFPLISIPIITVLGLEFGSTLAFAVVTETIYSWPGVGKLIIDSITALDRPVMVAYLMLVALLFIIINFVVDLTTAVMDPRIAAKAHT